MKRKPDEPSEVPSRENNRYTIPLQLEIEVSQGFGKGKERVTARPVDLSIGGVACYVPSHKAYRVGKRFRIFIADFPCFAEVRNMSVEGDLTRLGMSFIRLELDIQERIVDAIQHAKTESSRLKPDS